MGAKMIQRLPLFLLLSLMLATHCFAKSGVVLDVVYPKNRARVEVDEFVFVYGNVRPFTASVFVEGRKAGKYREGVFLARVPAKPGAMKLKITAISRRDTMTVEREITIPKFRFVTAGRAAHIDESFIFPVWDFSVRAGDKVFLLIKGTPKSRVTYEIPGLIRETVMRELRRPRAFKTEDCVFPGNRQPVLPNIRGIYAAKLIAPEHASGEAHQIIFHLQAPDGSRQKLAAPGGLRILKNPHNQIFYLEQPQIFSDQTMKTGSLLFLPKNSLMRTDGSAGRRHRIFIEAQNPVWVAEIETFRDSLPRQISSNRIHAVRHRSLAKSVQVRIVLNQKTGYKITQSAESPSVSVTLFGVETTGAKSWKKIEHDPFIEKLEVSRSGENDISLDFEFSGSRLWGYKAFFEGAALVLEFRRAPQFSPDAEMPLKNLVICLDPGHGPDEGAVGPSRLIERDMTAEYSLRLKKLLESRGASVVLTRQKNTGINLYSRTALAELVQADLFISLHFNALPDNASLFRVRGSGTYFYHDQSEPLAEAVQNRLAKSTNPPNFGTRRGNFAVCRTTAMPAILIETAFIVQPVEERKIKSPFFQKNVCLAIAGGIVDFVRQSEADIIK